MKYKYTVVAGAETVAGRFVKRPVVGQEGFFDTYRIKFEKDHDIFEVVPARR